MNEQPSQPAAPVRYLSAPAHDSVPVHLVTGFLGAGKTTLINRLLSAADTPPSAVIVNEFGEIPLDHHLLGSTGQDRPVLELANGCVCCSLQGEVAAALETLSTRDPAPVQVILETTGLADPLPVLQSLESLGTSGIPFRRGLSICLAAASTLGEIAARHPEARRQLALADIVAVSRLDLEADPAASLAGAAGFVSTLNPDAEVVAAGDLILPLEHCQTVNAGKMDIAARSHSHDHRHTSRTRALSFTTGRRISRAALEAFLELAVSAHGDRILRMKGLVAVEGEQCPALVQTIGRMASEPELLEKWPAGEAQTQLTIICEGMDPAFVRSLFLGFAGVPQADMPDLAGHRDNPLAIPGL